MLALALKLTLAPGLVAMASLTERRWGQALAGWVIGFPIVAGPILFFYAWEQGPAFAARAATQTLLGLVSLTIFCLAYAWTSRRHRALASLLVGWIAFALLTAVLRGVDVSPAFALASALAVLAGARKLLPDTTSGAASDVRPWGSWELPVRAAATATLVLLLTGLASALGPSLSGLLTPFPIATAVLVVAAHRRTGWAAGVRVLRGLLAGLFGFAFFCVVLAYGLTAWGIPASFAAGLLASTLTQAAVVRRL